LPVHEGDIQIAEALANVLILDVIIIVESQDDVTAEWFENLGIRQEFSSLLMDLFLSENYQK
jgi:hypothetical protein